MFPPVKGREHCTNILSMLFDRKNRMDMEQIVPSSKMALKLQALRICNGDVADAQKLYTFLAEGMKDLPDIDPVEPSGMAKVISGADSVISWIGSHQQDLMQGMAMVQSLRSGMPPAVEPPVNIEPIPAPR